MQKKKVRISNCEQIIDKSLVTTFKINSDLSRMKDELTFQNSAKNSECSLNETFNPVSRRSDKLETNVFTQSWKKKNKLGLRKVLEQQRVKNIVRNFLIKLKRNIPSSSPVEYKPYQKTQQNGFFIKQGCKLPTQFDLLHSIVSIILVLIISFIYPITIVFQNFMGQSQIFQIQIVCVFFYFIQMCTNFISVKAVQGRRITVIKDIIMDYFKRKFPVDLLCLTILIIDALSQSRATQYLRLIVLIKIKQCLQKLEKVQNMLINNFYKEQYWALTKVFLVNFVFAHCLAILLIAVSKLSSQQNWLKKINADNAPWYQQYVWAYYWGSTIMLTVGFGDITVSNYKQAICITLIEAFSCILLAYNINCVGNLISNIRQQDIEKNKNFKIVKRLVDQNHITQELEYKVCNFIDESDKMKKKFGFEAEKQFIGKLPSELKADILKQSNIKIFENLYFFKSFSEKTLLTLAEQIQVKITHPEQIILKAQSKPRFIILRQGQMGYCTKISQCQFEGTVIDLVKITKKNDPQILSLNFLNFKEARPKFQIKCLSYSMVYKISLSDFIQIIRNSQSDFQSFCQIKDKSKHIVDQFQVLHCQHCPTKHSKMICPKLHYIPYHQLVVFRHLEEVKNGNCDRQQVQRRDINDLSVPLKLRKHFRRLQQQIYKGAQNLTMKKSRILKNENSTSSEQEHQFQFIQKERSIRPNIRNTSEENKILLAKVQRNIVDKLNKVLQQRSTIETLPCWDVQLDIAQNYKCYFHQFNALDMNLYLKKFKNDCQRRPQSAQEVLSCLKTMKRSQNTQRQLN